MSIHGHTAGSQVKPYLQSFARKLFKLTITSQSKNRLDDRSCPTDALPDECSPLSVKGFGRPTESGTKRPVTSRNCGTVEGE